MRAWRAFLGLSVWTVSALSAACASHGAEGSPGASNVAPGAPNRRPQPAPPPARWRHLAALSTWPIVIEDRASRGHGSGGHRIEVRVSPPAESAYRALIQGSTLPVGSVVAALHHDATRGRPGPIYAMEKIAAERWEYRVVERDGRVRPGSVELCARCHAEGVADQLFGPPLSTPAKE